MNKNELLEKEYNRATTLYSLAQPYLMGRLVLDQEAVVGPGIAVDEIVDQTVAALNSDPVKSANFSKTFGKLGIYLALDTQPTSFTIEPVNTYPKGDVKELATANTYMPSEFLRFKNTDDPVSFVLCDQSTQAEMILIQALHLFDSAIVTGQLSPGEIGRPLLFTSDEDSVLKLRSDNPDLLLRLYGNVRGLSAAPTILGTTLPTRLLEASNIPVREFVSPEGKEPRLAKKVFVGITTAKRPHIGHGFLIAKALGEAGENGQVIVELNDRGPRVAAMVEKLASNFDQPFALVADAITDGEINPDAIEQAYVDRGEPTSRQLPKDFALTKPNIFYRRLLSRITPMGADMIGISDADITRMLMPVLKQKSGFRPVFDTTSGMSLLRTEGQATLLENNGETTVGGLLSALSLLGDLTVVDSPPPLNRNQLKVLAENDLTVSLSPGIGVSIDFMVGSGSQRNSLDLQELIKDMEAEGLETSKLLLVLRQMLETAYFVPGDGNSLNPNYASLGALQIAFREGVLQVMAGTVDSTKIFQPLTLKNVTKALVSSVIDLGPLQMTNKTTVELVRSYLKNFPTLGTTFSQVLLGALEQTQGGTIPKNRFSENDKRILQSLRSTSPDAILKLCIENYEVSPDVFGDRLSQTDLGRAATAMGYEPSQYGLFLKRLKEVKEIYAPNYQ